MHEGIGVKDQQEDQSSGKSFEKATNLIIILRIELRKPDSRLSRVGKKNCVQNSIQARKYFLNFCFNIEIGLTESSWEKIEDTKNGAKS